MNAPARRIGAAVDFWLRELRGTWSRREVLARVVEVVDETADTKSFVLAPNAAWRGHRAGQHTWVEVEIDGVRTGRCYSLSSPPGARFPTITVKRAARGRVSGWLHDHVRPGHLLRLGQATGEFVLPDVLPPKLLFLTGGSGITPALSMLPGLAGRDVILVHHARSAADVIGARTLDALRRDGLRVILCLDDDPARGRGFDPDELARRVADFGTRETFLCGPPGMMDAAFALWRTAGAEARRRHERFAAAALIPPSADPAAAAELRLTRSGRRISGSQSATLLEQLERAGERPPYGCRMGICRTCRCRKQTGAVENLLTGGISSAPDEDIQLCISVPRSDVELGL